MQATYIQNRQGSLIFTAGIFLTAGVTLLLSWPWLLKLIIEEGLALKPNSLMYKMWHKNPVPLHLDFYMFNWTNPEDIHNNTIKPKFKEIGPIVFTEIKEKVNITWNENGTVSFRQTKKWIFDKEASVIGLDTNVTTVNAVSLTASYQARNWGFWMKKGFQFTVNQVAPEVHITKPIGQILFDGYDDFFVTMGKKLPFLGDFPDYDKFGWFYTRNTSAEFDGLFNMMTDSKHLGELLNWNNVNQTHYYEDACGRVHGSQGELYPPGLTRSQISFFSPDMCRNVPLDYEKDEIIDGILGYKYSVSSSFLDNGTLIPENKCYCPGECLPSGAVNISACRYGTPGFVSLPHFYGADSYYTDATEGLNPNAENHEFHMTLEPTTSLPLAVSARLQLNLLMQPIEYLTLFEDVPRVLFPVLWFEQTVVMPSHLTFLIKLFLNLPLICQCIGSAFLLTGLILLTFVIYKPVLNLLKADSPKDNYILREMTPLQEDGAEKIEEENRITEKFFFT